MVVESAPVNGVGSGSCDAFLVRGAYAFFLVDGSGSHLSEVSGLWVQYAFGQSFWLWQS